MRRAPSPPIHFKYTNYEVISATQKLEEEYFDDYRTGKYYPVRIGDVFASKYQVLGKLGFGVSSTVWLARDLEYVHFRFLNILSTLGPILSPNRYGIPFFCNFSLHYLVRLCSATLAPKLEASRRL